MLPLHLGPINGCSSYSRSLNGNLSSGSCTLGYRRPGVKLFFCQICGGRRALYGSKFYYPCYCLHKYSSEFLLE
nr:MAG: hypothetical protein [Wufeng shrew polycipivirus 4]